MPKQPHWTRTAWSGQPDQHTVVFRPKIKAPETSWWLCASDQFYEKAHQEAERMTQSRTVPEGKIR